MHSRTRASLASAALAAFLAAVHGSPARPEPLHILQETDGGGAPEPESPPLPEGLRWFSATYSVQGATYHIEGVEPADGPRSMPLPGAGGSRKVSILSPAEAGCRRGSLPNHLDGVSPCASVTASVSGANRSDKSARNMEGGAMSLRQTLGTVHL